MFYVWSNVPGVDVRIHERSNSTEIFMPSSTGFTLDGKENIVDFVKIGKEITKHIARVDRLEELVIKAYGIMFNLHQENSITQPQMTHVMTIIDTDEFTIRWDRELNRRPYKDDDGFKITAADMYSYILKDRIVDFGEYVECVKYLLSPM